MLIAIRSGIFCPQKDIIIVNNVNMENIIFMGRLLKKKSGEAGNFAPIRGIK